jgi:AcrR family transcriptional regulator
VSAQRDAPGPRRRDAEMLAAAADVFYRHGYAEATIRDIAETLGILKGSLYYYIETKEDLLFRLLTSVQDDVDRIRAETVGRDDLEPLDRLERYVRRQAEYNVRNLVLITVFLHDLDQLTGPRREQVLARRKLHQGCVEDVIREAQAAGLVDPESDATVLRHCVFASIVWTYRWYRQSGRARPEAVADLCAYFVLGGLRRSALRTA